MGLFSKSTRDKDFDVEAQPPLVTATPVPASYAAASVPTPEQAASDARINKVAREVPPLNPPLGRPPTFIPLCPHCGAVDASTRTSTYPALETWLLCLGVLLIFWPACWVPLVVDSAKRTDHLCNRCNEVVGTVKPLSDCCVKNRG
ncbi:hypothetical protein ACHAWF_014647 [Thalassiosira exigua]